MCARGACRCRMWEWGEDKSAESIPSDSPRVGRKLHDVLDRLVVDDHGDMPSRHINSQAIKTPPPPSIDGASLFFFLYRHKVTGGGEGIAGEEGELVIVVSVYVLHSPLLSLSLSLLRH